MSLSKFAVITKEQLETLYAERSILKIAAMYGVEDETVRKRLIKFGIPRRPRGGKRDFDPPADVLRDLYQTMSMREIAKKFGVGETVVWKRLQEHGIKLRDFEAGGHRLKPGRIFTKAHRLNISLANTGKWAGDKNPHWKGGAQVVNLRLRASGAYRRWKQDALALRGNKCQGCGVANGTVCECCGTRVRLHVHHVESFAKVPDKRFDPSNSEILCAKCHHSRHRSKPGEFGGSPNVESRVTPSEAAEGDGSAERVTTRR